MNSYNEWANFTTPAPQEGESDDYNIPDDQEPEAGQELYRYPSSPFTDEWPSQPTSSSAESFTAPAIDFAQSSYGGDSVYFGTVPVTVHSQLVPELLNPRLNETYLDALGQEFSLLSLEDVLALPYLAAPEPLPEPLINGSWPYRNTENFAATSPIFSATNYSPNPSYSMLSDVSTPLYTPGGLWPGYSPQLSTGSPLRRPLPLSQPPSPFLPAISPVLQKISQVRSARRFSPTSCEKTLSKEKNREKEIRIPCPRGCKGTFTRTHDAKRHVANNCCVKEPPQPDMECEKCGSKAGNWYHYCNWTRHLASGQCMGRELLDEEIEEIKGLWKWMKDKAKAKAEEEAAQVARVAPNSSIGLAGPSSARVDSGFLDLLKEK